MKLNNYLYNSLLPDTSLLNKNIIIIPDEELHYIPFEQLVMDTSFLARAYDLQVFTRIAQNSGFLIQKYNISYANSTSLFFDNHLKKNVLAHKDYVVFAPFVSSNSSDTTLKDSYMSLSDNEVNFLQTHYPTGDIFKNTQASKAQLKNITPTNVLLISTHADKNGVVYFKTLKDGKGQVEKLFVHDVYVYEIPAKLAMLTACETGIGNLVKGEGMLSLARAFRYAGCPSLVSTHWKVNDKSTAEISCLFLEQLRSGATKNTSISDAKKAYIRSCLEEGNFEGLHPYYWSGILLVGDTSPIYDNEKFNVFHIIGAIIFLIFPPSLVLLILFKKKEINK